MPHDRTYADEIKYLTKIDEVRYKINEGFVPNMKVPGIVYANDKLYEQLVDELKVWSEGTGTGFIPALKQIANVASLPGIVGYSMGMPDAHSGYGFAIGNVAAFDMNNPEAVVSPGGVGFDINCGMRLIRTNLKAEDVAQYKELLAEKLFEAIPVGVGGEGVPLSKKDVESILAEGIDWTIKKGYAWQEDKEHCEENGRMKSADPDKVSDRAKTRGRGQAGTLGAGNHYVEVQCVDEVFDENHAKAMGLEKGQVCIYIHTGSRGLGHQVATDFLQVMEKAMARDKIKLNDRQLACARINSKEAQDYLKAMAAACNFAWVNRQMITYHVRQVFSEIFKATPRELGMHLVYDVCHNVAKIEDHVVDGKQMKLLVHRKGSTRAFGPHHTDIPKDYKDIGQPVLIGGTMATCSYVLTGTEQGMKETFGSTCHGAGRLLSRHAARSKKTQKDVANELRARGVSIRIGNPKLIMEEAGWAYKDVNEVVNTCHNAGIAKLCCKLNPMSVIKG